MKPHPYEVIEILPSASNLQFRLLLTVAGPWTAPPDEGGGREPWHVVGLFRLSQSDLVVTLAEALSLGLSIPIQDLVGITSDPHGSIRHDDGPEAA